MSTSVLARRAVLTACILALAAACGSQPDGVPVLGMNAQPRQLPLGGGETDVLVETKDGKGLAGTGTVKVTTNVGSFAGGGKSADIALSDGKGTVKFTCLTSAEPGCVGTVTIAGNWNGTTSQVSVIIAGTAPVADGGTGTDAGMAAGDCSTYPNALRLTGDGWVFKGSQLFTTGKFEFVPLPSSEPRLQHISLKAFTDQTKPNEFWSVSFGALKGENLAVGQYPNADRLYGDPAKPGLDINGYGRGCSAIAGSFDIKRLTITRGAVTDFIATFEQFCDNIPNDVLRGCIRVTGPAGNDEPPDSGMAPDSGMSGVSDAGLSVSLSSSRNPIFVSIGDSTQISAKVTRSDGGPMANEEVMLGTDLGIFDPADGGMSGTSISVQTNVAGIASARFTDTGTKGTATITATHLASGAVATLPLTISEIGTITHDKTVCSGNVANCSVMGVKGSGFQEQAAVTFKVMDASNTMPVAGAKVLFTIANKPTGTTVQPEGVTNSQGLVTTNVSSGIVAGVFKVTAQVEGAPSKQVDSSALAIRGAKASNRGFTMACGPVNISAHVATTPPADIPVTCNILVQDRYSNPVGVAPGAMSGQGPTVSFKLEAGSLPSNQAVTGYPQANEGRATVTFRSSGTYPPVNVDPLPAAPSQYPFARFAEPSVFPSPFVENNPRDSLVTLIAYMPGEEHFSDENQNGTWDPGEQFIDQGEPFVDSDDNNVRDTGEDYLDLNNNGSWDGPNGSWNSNTTIYTEARILYTDVPIAGVPYSWVTLNPFTPACPSGVPKGGKVDLFAVVGDAYLNRPPPSVTTVGFTHTSTKGMATLITTALPDGFGFGYERRLVNAADDTECKPTTGVCRWKTLFYGWQPTILSGTISGAATTDMTPCSSDIASFRVTVPTSTMSISSIGAVQ